MEDDGRRGSSDPADSTQQSLFSSDKDLPADTACAAGAAARVAKAAALRMNFMMKADGFENKVVTIDQRRSSLIL